MAKRKIVWSDRAKKRLYGIFEFYIERNKSKSYSIKLYKLLNKEVKLLLKYPDLGLKTSEESAGRQVGFAELGSDVDFRLLRKVEL